MPPLLCLKSGNASILRGGKEAIHSNQAIYQCIEQGLLATGLPQFAVQVVNTRIDRSAVGAMLNMPEYHRCHYSARWQIVNRTNRQRIEYSGHQTSGR